MLSFAEVAREAARVATGLLGWDPERFWQATPAELVTALEGRLRPAGEVRPLAGAELAQLIERLDNGRGV